MLNEQKFHYGDYVHIAKNLGPHMSHFTADEDAIVIGSYADQYGGRDTHSYTLHIKGRGRVSWYEEQQLTLLEKNRADLLQTWKDAEKAEADLKGDLDWIFSHGEEVLTKPHHASVESLAACFGLNNLWGRHGEGITYYMNTKNTLRVAAPFLITGAKDSWLKLCKESLHA